MRMILFMATVFLAAAIPVTAADAPAAVDPGPASRWPVAIENWWQQRAAETIMLGDEAWSIRVKLAGEKLVNARESMRRPYEHPDAPLYMRLRDGHGVATIEEAIAAGIKDGRLLTGKLVMHKKQWMIETGPRTMRRLSNLTESDEAMLADREGKHVRLVQAKGEDGYQLVHVEAVTPTPEQLRAWCAAQGVTAFPDARPVEEVTVKRTPLPRIDISRPQPYKVEHIYTYTWPRQELVIPPAAR